MTSGVIGSLSAVLNPTMTGIEYARSWSGQNGRQTIFNGRLVQKWNDYSTEVASRNRNRNYFQLLLQRNRVYPNPHNLFDRMIEILPASVTLNGFGQVVTFTNNDHLTLLNKLVKKVEGHDFNLAVNLAQSNQLVDMVGLNLRKFGRSLLALKRGNFALAARQLGIRKVPNTRLKVSDISGRWLELQYGWLPALSDTFEAAKAYESITKGPRKLTVSASRLIGSTFEGSQSPSNYSAKYDESYRRGIRYEMSESMSIPRSLGLADPLSVLWEVIPYSFVADWFLPIGAYLEALNSVPHLVGRFLTTSTRKQYGFRNIMVTGYKPMDHPTVKFGVDWGLLQILQAPSSDVFRRTVMVRTYSTSLAVPLPNPTWGGIVGSKRLYNAVALFHQKLK
jgi:hypothetical protein